MILYPGSNVAIEQPHLVKQTRFLDFGPGFYTNCNLLRYSEPKKLFNQMVFTSDRALSYLKYIGTLDMVED